ncbi:hypothetical protein DZF95_00925 [Clavibacter michiganensis]|nr:hypothetical protein DZF95_00925 [Clavibacter michiganensis]
MDKPEIVTLEDRTILIGVLANLSAAFLGVTGDARADARSMLHMTERYRSDFAGRLGRAPSDEECRVELEAQVARLRRSIGEERG